jgi:CBS-domain-containing membrane protein
MPVERADAKPLALAPVRVLLESVLVKILRWIGLELIEVSWTEKAVATIGSALAIFCVFWITLHSLPAMAAAGVIASMGATAVLLYAVPHGPLSQPWPLLGGHTLSAIIGVTCAVFIEQPAIAAATAVGLSIGVMYQLKCVHPPGGATAFTAVMGGAAVHDLGYAFVLYPVLLNAVTMFVLAVVINSPFAWRRYPAVLVQRRSRSDQPQSLPQSQSPAPDELHEDVLSAIRSLDAFVDINEGDLLYLTQEIATRIDRRETSELRTLVRSSENLQGWNQPERYEADDCRV